MAEREVDGYAALIVPAVADVDSFEIDGVRGVVCPFPEITGRRVGVALRPAVRQLAGRVDIAV